MVRTRFGHATRPVLIALVGAVLASGCTPTQSIDVSVPMAVPFSRYPEVSVEVIPTAEGTKELKTRLETLILVELRRLAVFERVAKKREEESDEADLHMLLDVVEIHRISPLKRTLLGIFAGREGLSIAVTCKDAHSGSVLCDFRVRGASAAGNVFSKGLEQAMATCLGFIAQYVNKYR